MRYNWINIRQDLQDGQDFRPTIQLHPVNPVHPVQNCKFARPPDNLQKHMALCDDLKAKLNQSQTDGAKLMEAVVAGLVGA